MTQVISANYRDRTSPYKWLVRDEDQEPEQATACKQVLVAGQVRFERSGKEMGFGCSVVATTSADVLMVEPEPPEGAEKFQELKFDSYHDFEDLEGRVVKRVDELNLLQDGKIMAILPASRTPTPATVNQEDFAGV